MAVMESTMLVWLHGGGLLTTWERMVEVLPMLPASPL